MNKTNVITAILVLSTIVFGTQALGNLSSGNLFFLCFNVAICGYHGRMAYHRIKKTISL